MVFLFFDLLRSSFRATGFKVKIVGPGRQPGNFLSKAKESNQRRLCAALGISCSGWSVGESATALDEQGYMLFCFYC
jgi:hypothetical protein